MAIGNYTKSKFFDNYTVYQIKVFFDNYTVSESNRYDCIVKVHKYSLSVTWKSTIPGSNHIKGVDSDDRHQTSTE